MKLRVDYCPKYLSKKQKYSFKKEREKLPFSNKTTFLLICVTYYPPYLSIDHFHHFL